MGLPARSAATGSSSSTRSTSSSTAFAELGAGVTIDIDLGWFGHVRITISVHLHADVTRRPGREFHGGRRSTSTSPARRSSSADDDDRSTPVLDWARFDDKYMRPGGAARSPRSRAAALVPPSPADSGDPATGEAGDPFLLLPEFELSADDDRGRLGGGRRRSGGDPRRRAAAIGPMQVGAATSTLSVSVRRDGSANDLAATLEPSATTGAFPKGVWGPQPADEQVPKGETVTAANGVHLTSRATLSDPTVAIDSHQVEVDDRHPLPFLAEQLVRGERLSDVDAATALVEDAPEEVDAVLSQARDWMIAGALGAPLTPLAAATFRTARAAPPQLAPLTLGMAVDPDPEPEVPDGDPPPEPPVVDTSIKPPRVEAFLSSTPSRAVREQPLTTVGDQGAELPRFPPPTRAEVLADQEADLATQLLRTSACRGRDRRNAGRRCSAVLGPRGRRPRDAPPGRCRARAARPVRRARQGARR